MPAPRPQQPSGVPMRDLLASCAAARAISSPPAGSTTRPEGARGTARPATAHPQAHTGLPD
nr:hypothetical protein [Streptomyces sp. L2]